MDIVMCDREAVNVTCDPDHAGVNCIENVDLTPAIEAMPASQAAAEEKDCRASCDRECGSQDKEIPGYTNPGQETVAPGARPSDSSETPRTETTTEKNPWSAWAWLGLCKNASRKIPNIVHVDVDAFFASVEQVLNPRLRGKPVLVGRGVVASASYEAKSQGVRTAMSFREARRVCPKAVVVPGQYEHYADFAERVRRILETYTPAVETAALDISTLRERSDCIPITKPRYGVCRRRSLAGRA